MEPLAWCRERMLMPGSSLAASLPFAPADERDRILALRCVCSELAATLSRSGEAAVAGASLQWWDQALRDPNQSHPALLAMASSGAWDRLQPDDFRDLLAGVAGSVQPSRFERFAELWTLCRQVGGHEAALEVRLLEGGEAVCEVFRELGGAHYLVRIVRDLVIDARANRWLVPLELQADYQVARQDALEKSPSRAFSGLVRALLAEAIGRAQRAEAGLSQADRARQVHLLTQWGLDRRLARCIDRRPERLFQERVAPGHWGNVWCAWRSARAAVKA